MISKTHNAYQCLFVVRLNCMTAAEEQRIKELLHFKLPGPPGAVGKRSRS